MCYYTLIGDASDVLSFEVVAFVLFIIMLGYGTVRRFRQEWLLACSASALFSVMVLCLLISPYLASNDRVEIGVAFLVLGLCWNFVMLFVPLRELTQRLIFVVLGVLTLVGLSEISKLNLHQYLQPPKVSDNLVR